MRLQYFIAALVLLFSLSAEAQQAPSVSLNELIAVPKPDAIQRLVGSLAPAFFDIRINWYGGGPIGLNPELQNVSLFTRPEAAGPGLCRSTELLVSYTAIGNFHFPDNVPNGDTPVRPTQFTTTSYFGIVGSLTRDYDRGYRQEMREACAQLVNAGKFFPAPSAAAVKLVALTVDDVAQDARSGSPLPFQVSCAFQICEAANCQGSLCTAWRTFLGWLSSDGLRGVGPGNCNEQIDCFWASLHSDPDPLLYYDWNLLLEFDKQTKHLRAVTISSPPPS